jgi:hypothetical protein
MINDGINDVPDKTIAIFNILECNEENLTKNRISKIVSIPGKKRDWFTPHFYRCLPLAIGNQYGFVISAEFDFCFEWNGGDQITDITLSSEERASSLNEDEKTKVYPKIMSHFGSGILTIETPFFIRTPPGINIMTINPPNHVIPNITVMTGVVETDNLRQTFTFNLKIQMPNIKVCIPAGTPLAAFIPVPRYFVDEFQLKFADELFDKQTIDEEKKAENDARKHRGYVQNNLKDKIEKHYMLGKDIYNNKFPDHQKP